MVTRSRQAGSHVGQDNSALGCFLDAFRVLQPQSLSGAAAFGRGNLRTGVRQDSADLRTCGDDSADQGQYLKPQVSVGPQRARLHAAKPPKARNMYSPARGGDWRAPLHV